VIYYFNPVNRMTGLASGLDTKSIVEDLMKAARIPLDRMLQNEQLLQWKQEDYRVLNATLSDFRAGYAFYMELQSTFMVKKTASGDETAVTAVAGASAKPGTYNIKVTQLAEVASDISTDTISANSADKIDPAQTLESQSSKFRNAPASGSFTITTRNPVTGATNTKTFNVDITSDSLNSVLSKINSETSLGLTAFYDASIDKVVLSTTFTGDDSASNEIEVSGDFLLNTLLLSSTAQGKNALFDLNGAAGIAKYENTFTLNNVTFTLKKTTSSPVLITVQTDTDTIVQKIKDFVEQYNAALEKINTKLSEPRYRDYLPLTEEQKKEMPEDEIKQWEEKARSGLLQYDPLLQSIVYDIRTAVTGTVSGLPASMNSLIDIGITEGYMLNDEGKIILGAYTEGGKLYVNENILRDAVTRDPEGVMNLFTQTGATEAEKGIGVRVYDALNRRIKQLTDQAGPPNSSYTYDNSFISTSIRELQDRINAESERLARLEESYWRQFTVMEQFIAQMNAQSMWLAQQFNIYAAG